MKDIWAERKLKKFLSKETNKIEKKKIKGKAVILINIDSNVSNEYISVSEASLVLNITRRTLITYIKNKNIFTRFKQHNTGTLTERYLIKFKDNS